MKFMFFQTPEFKVSLYFLYLAESSVINVRTDAAITLPIYFQLRIKSVHYIFRNDSVEGNAAVTPSANNNCLNKALHT